MDWFLHDNGLRHKRVKCVYYLHCKVVHVLIYEAKRRYAFCSYLYNYFYSYIYFFQSKRITKKAIKVIEDEICCKLFEVYKGTERVVLVKFVEPFLLVEAISFS